MVLTKIFFWSLPTCEKTNISQMPSEFTHHQKKNSALILPAVFGTFFVAGRTATFCLSEGALCRFLVALLPGDLWLSFVSRGSRPHSITHSTQPEPAGHNDLLVVVASRLSTGGNHVGREVTCPGQGQRCELGGRGGLLALL